MTGITVTGYGEASAPPDVFHARLTINCDGTDVSTAMRDAAERTAAVTSALRTLGLADRELRTTGLAVRPRHNRDGAHVGYTASHRLTATCHDVELGGRLLATASEAAGNQLGVDHIGLEVDDQQPVLRQAREKAFMDARTRAGEYAALAGRELGPVELVQEGIVAPPVPFAGVRTLQQADYGGELGIEAGENTVNASVTVTWSWA